MTAQVVECSRESAEELISSAINGRLTEDEVKCFMSWVRGTPKMWIGLINEELVCMWGLIPPTLLSDQAYLWLHTTPAVEGNEFIFIRRSQIVMRDMLRLFPRIVGHCRYDAEQSQRWLRFLGAKFSSMGDGPHLPFMIEASHG